MDFGAENGEGFPACGDEDVDVLIYFLTEGGEGDEDHLALRYLDSCKPGAQETQHVTLF